MYTLRTVTNTCTSNQLIGDNYSMITKTYHSENFNSRFKRMKSGKDGNETDKKIYAFLETQTFSIPLYKGDQYYIVNEHGKTFENLTAK